MQQKEGYGMVTKRDLRDYGFYILGVEFPANREAITRRARWNQAPEDFVEGLGEIPDQLYTDEHAVEVELRKLCPGETENWWDFNKGLIWPLTRENLIRGLLRNGAPFSIAQLIRQYFEDRLYESAEFSRGWHAALNRRDDLLEQK